MEGRTPSSPPRKHTNDGLLRQSCGAAFPDEGVRGFMICNSAFWRGPSPVVHVLSGTGSAANGASCRLVTLPR